MPTLYVGGRRFEVDVVVFDKDGTLLDFNRLWALRTVRWVEALGAMSSPQLVDALYRAIGFDAERAVFVPDGPMAIASMNDIYALAAGVLFQQGYDWHEARPLVARAAEGTIAAPPRAEEIAPRGDVAGTMRRLRQAGVQVAVATHDERNLTQAMLEEMGVAGDVALMVCGDDAFAPKPDPAGLRWLAAELDTVPGRMAMVGDSANDMLAGRRAGVAACIGVLGGAGARESLAQTADVLVAEVGELEAVRGL